MLTKQQRDNWSHALRHGGLEQGTAALCNFNSYAQEAHEYCCLGVYCHAVLDIPNDDLIGYGLTKTLAFSVMKSEANTKIKAGQDFGLALDSYTFKFYQGMGMYHTVKGENAFAHMNDGIKWSFNRIANVIDALPVREQ